MKLLEKLKGIITIPYCEKTELGYTCHHRIMSNGKKECGDESSVS